ncbi:hypothetical protein Tsubulata_033093 [Turnera subulata]|uniref:DUF4283 domain-containing protein n=1 Tax=Turnera subulata TaxID=218843 RepID=A0A9Q0FI59_9ROSI|nr:hypothetical protein Tsubulata_033093 [Turnera subulata]
MAEPPSRRVIDLGGETAQQDSISPEESLGAIVARTYDIGKVLGDRRPHISQIRSQMQSVWYIKGDFCIIPKINNIFLIGFELEEDKKKVLKGSLWLILDIPPNLLTHNRVVKIGAVFTVFHFYEPTLEAMYIKPPRPDEGVEKPAENSFGPWIRAKETLGKYYPAKKHVPLEMAEPNIEEVNPPNTGYNGRAPSTSSSSEKQGEDPVSRKRKLPEEDVLLSPISESARRGHTGLMNTVAELVTDLHDTAPIHALSSKPSWKKMARRAKVVYQPTPVELIQAFEATVEGSKDAMGQEARNGLEVGAVVVEPSPAGD